MFEKLLKWLVPATVIYTISIVLLSCGGTAATKQPVQQFPHMTLPSVQVKALYTGADIRTLLDAVVPPLKDSIFHYVEDMDYMTYTANSDGSLLMTIYFKPGTNLDEAALNVSNVVTVATAQLPSPVVQSGVTVLKQNEAIVMAVDIYSEDTAQYNQAFLTNYAAINIIPGIQRIPGVSHLSMPDENKDSLVRIWISKGQMTALNLTLKEVLAAIPAKKLEAVTGILHKNSKQTFDYIIKCKNEHAQLVGYENLMIHRNADTALTLKEVAAKVELGPYVYGNFTHISGKRGISIVVMQLADSNVSGIQPAIKKLMKTASTDFPTGIKHSMLFNPEDSLYISVE